MSRLRSLPYAVLTIGLLAAGSASAQSMSSIDQREANQEQRIRDGRRDGSLTRGEAARLEQGEQRINRYEARARADGVVTPAERQRLDNMLDRESRAIHNERTDGQRAGGRDNDRGNHYGWESNRGNHYGRDNDRGNQNGRNHASANGNGAGDSDRNRGAWGTRAPGNDRRDQSGVNRPEHGAYNGQPQAAGASNNPHGSFNGQATGGGQSPATTPSATPRTDRPATVASSEGRMTSASAPAPRTSSTSGRSSRY